MKRISIYLLACLTFAACSDQYTEVSGLSPSLVARHLDLSISTNYIYFNSEAQSGGIQIKSVNTPWKIENGIEWLSLSELSGETSAEINITVKENLSGDTARVGVFYVNANISDWNKQLPVSVMQNAAIPYINVSQTSVAMKGSANTISDDVTANCTYHVSSTADWLSIEQKGNSLTLTATANETDQHRDATVVLNHSGNLTVKTNITVSQAPASITASAETLSFENTASEMKVSMESEAKWTASTSYSWIDLSPTSGEAGKSEITISVTPNSSTSDRTGYVILSIGSKEKIQIPITQCGIYIETDKSQCDFNASSGTQSVQVKSNSSWQVTSIPSWIKVDKTSGSGNSEIKVTAEDNPNTTERTGEFVVSQPGLSLTTTVKVHQKGKTFDVATTTLTFNDKEETQTVSISTDGSWQASTKADWIQLSPKSATGSSTLNIRVSENTSEGERNASVVITMGDTSATIAVVQKGKYFTIDNSLLDFPSKGGNLAVLLTTNSPWTARIGGNADWLSVSPTNGNTNTDVKITAADNATVNSRSANVYFEALGKNVNILITQKARYLTLDANELLFYAKGGTSNTVTISTDGTYSINCSDSWFKLTKKGDSFTVTATENNTINARTGKVTVSLTDLKEGTCSVTLIVTQLNYGGTFLRNEFGEDKNYDTHGSSTGSLVITGYGNDTNYDTSNQSNTSLSVIGVKAYSN